MGIALGVAGRRTHVGAIVHSAGGALARCWIAYTGWRMERWATRRLRATAAARRHRHRASQAASIVKGASVPDARGP
jgi:hypothetical protein